VFRSSTDPGTDFHWDETGARYGGLGTGVLIFVTVGLVLAVGAVYNVSLHFPPSIQRIKYAK